MGSLKPTIMGEGITVIYCLVHQKINLGRQEAAVNLETQTNVEGIENLIQST